MYPRYTKINLTDKSNYLNIVTNIIANDYGFQNSLDADIPLDKDHQPLPLYTYPAIEYLNSLNFNHKRIFEFGSGNSTIYWLKNGANVISVEHNQDWIDRVSSSLKNFNNHQYIFANQQEQYINSILQFDDYYFDLIIIDGTFNRYLCAENILTKIKQNGLVILDNSDWYPNSAKFLKENLNFLQIDFYGFRPAKSNTSVTSLFFSREFNYQSKTQKQPSYAIGGKIKHSNNDK